MHARGLQRGIDMKKLSLNKIFFISEVVLIPIVLFGTYLVLGTERSYSVLVDIMPYGGAYVAWLVYQSEYEIAPLPLYPISRINRIIGRIKNVCFAVLGSFIMYMLFSSFLHLFNPIDAERLVVSLLILFMLLEVFLYQMKSSRKLILISVVLYFIAVGLAVITPDIFQLTMIALFIMGFCIFWMYYQTVRKKS